MAAVLLVLRKDLALLNVITLGKDQAVWYTAEGSITALDYMLSDLEGVLLK